MLKCKLGNTFRSEEKNSKPLLHMLAYFKTGAGEGGGGGMWEGLLSKWCFLVLVQLKTYLLLPCIKHASYMKINPRTFKDKLVTSYSNAFILRKPQLVTWHIHSYAPSTWEGEAGRSRVWGPPGQHSNYEASLSYIVRHCGVKQWRKTTLWQLGWKQKCV